MFVISETNNSYGLAFIREYKSKSENISYENTIQVRSIKTSIDNKNYTLLYDSNMNIISNAFGFINFQLSKSSPNHISAVISALKLLYSFLELTSLKLDRLTRKDAFNLLNFLEGISTKGALFTFNLKTHRSSSTINMYLSFYRSYVSYLDISESIFLKKCSIKVKKYIPESEQGIEDIPYIVHKKQYVQDITTPKYISVSDFQKIIKIIRKKYTIKEEILVRLMYEAGLRIGEVLGLTNEDIVQSNDYATIFIKNRLTDSPDQHAKTCMHVYEKNDYLDSVYSTKDIGYQTVIITNNLFSLIESYLNEFHFSEKDSFNANYSIYNTADSTSNDDNFYLFINSKGIPLTANLWNKTLRKIFIECGLNVDINIRRNNLNHRFRHGYAMFMVKYNHVDNLKLMKLLRHKSISSVEKYYRPTDEDIIMMKNTLVKSIYDVIPQLNMEGWE